MSDGPNEKVEDETQTTITCPDCSGSGDEECYGCDGTGYILPDDGVGGSTGEEEEECPECDGFGTVECISCDGYGEVEP